MTPFAAVLFDLDNTLCRHEQDAETIYYGAFERAAVEPFGTPEEFWTAVPEPAKPDDQHERIERGFERVAARNGRTDVDPAALARGLRAVVDWSAVSLLPGARDVLAQAHTHGRVGLVTNGPERRQSIKLRALGLTDSFDIVVYAGDMQRRKPHADPFERALRRLDVEAHATLYVGDSLKYDVVGAQKAGLPVAWYPRDDGLDPGEHEPEYVIESLGELGPILRGRR